MQNIINFAVATPPSIPKVPINSTTLGGIFSGILALAGVLCVLFIIIGAINYIISAGDASKIKKAKDSILYAGVGLVVVGISFMIVQFVVGLFSRNV